MKPSAMPFMYTPRKPRKVAHHTQRKHQVGMAKASAIILLATTVVSGSLLHGNGNAKEIEQPVVATFSIVARDPATGELGIAVQSKFVAVGSVVPWAKAGVGAIATQ